MTKQIAALEADLGARLFERGNRAVLLTEVGRAFGRVVAAALAEISAETTRLRGGQAEGGIVLHCQLCEAFYWLMPRLSHFHERHTGVEVRIVSALAPRTAVPELFDVAIQTTGRPSGAARLAIHRVRRDLPAAAPGLVRPAKLSLSVGDRMQLLLLAHPVLPRGGEAAPHAALCRRARASAGIFTATW